MHIFERALEEAVCSAFNVKDCYIDFERKKIIPVIDPYCIHKWMWSEENKILELSFSQLNRGTILRCVRNFKRFMSLTKGDELAKKWRAKVHCPVIGQIRYAYGDEISVELGNNIDGTMRKPEWVPGEIPYYREGRCLWFYVLRIIEENSKIKVYLSRGSKNFPVALLKTRFPWVRFKALKRIRGKVSWIEASEKISKEILSEVSKELMGESLRLIIKR